MFVLGGVTFRFSIKCLTSDLKSHRDCVHLYKEDLDLDVVVSTDPLGQNFQLMGPPSLDQEVMCETFFCPKFTTWIEDDSFNPTCP